MPKGGGLVFGLILAPLPVHLKILSKHLLKLEAGLPFQLVVLLDVFLNQPQILKMRGESELLN